METLTPEEKIERGKAAERIITDEAVTKVFDDMHKVLHDQIDQQQADSPENVMSIVRQLRAIRAVRGKLESFVQEGKRESLTLEHKSKGGSLGRV